MNSISTLKFYYAGLILILALIIGGGTSKGLWTDHLMEIVMIPAIFLGFGNLHLSRFSWLSKALVIGFVGILLLQFLPVSRTLKIHGSDFEITSNFYSFSIQSSLDSALFAFAVAGFALFLSRFSEGELGRLFRFILIGLLVNLALVALQLSYSGGTRIEGILPFTITSASFANENHFSALVFATIPLLAFHYLVRVKKPLIYISFAAIISLCLFAVGSRAGMTMTICTTFICLFWFLSNNLSVVRRMQIAIIVTLLSIVAAYYTFDASSDISGARGDFLRNTVEAIKDNYLLGTGLGTFDLVYPSYEPVTDTFHAYANHAHNDYAEFILETGFLGSLLLLTYLFVVFRQFGKSALSQAAGLSMLALGIHSLIDYPLRTLALAVFFAYLAAILLTKPEMSTSRSGIKQSSE